MFTNNPIEDQIFLTFVAAESAKKNQPTNKLCAFHMY